MRKFLKTILAWLGTLVVTYIGYLAALLLAGALLLLAEPWTSQPAGQERMGFVVLRFCIQAVVAVGAGMWVVLLAFHTANGNRERAAAKVAYILGITFVLLSLTDSSIGFLTALLAILSGGWMLRQVLQPRGRKAHDERFKWRNRRRTSRRGTSLRSASRRGRRRRRRGIPAESPSQFFAISPAGMAALVFLFVWGIWSIALMIFHAPHRMEPKDLFAFGEMYGWWKAGCLMMLLYLAVDEASWVWSSKKTSRRRLATSLCTAITLALALAANSQWVIYYAERYRASTAPGLPTHRIEAQFERPTPLDPGDRGNQAWKDYEEWLGYLSVPPGRVRLRLKDDLTARYLAQATPDLWRLRCGEVIIQIEQGSSHSLLPPREVLRGDVLELDLVDEVFVLLKHCRLEPSDDLVDLDHPDQTYGARVPLDDQELPELIIQSELRFDSLPLLVPLDTPMSRLDQVLTELEEKGAKRFLLLFVEATP